MLKCQKLPATNERKRNLLKMCLLCIGIIIVIKKIIYLTTINISELEAEDATLHNIICV